MNSKALGDLIAFLTIGLLSLSLGSIWGTHYLNKKLTRIISSIVFCMSSVGFLLVVIYEIFVL